MKPSDNDPRREGDVALGTIEVTSQHRNAAGHIHARMTAHKAAGHTHAQVLDDMSDCSLIMQRLTTTLSYDAFKSLMREMSGLHDFLRLLERRGKAMRSS